MYEYRQDPPKGKLIPRLFCYVNNELSEHSHPSMTLWSPVHLIGRGTVAGHEDNIAAWPLNNDYSSKKKSKKVAGVPSRVEKT